MSVKSDCAQIGVDVGGTNTDAVALAGRRVLAAAKTATTHDVTTGVRRAVRAVLDQLATDVVVSRIHIGTTHFLNAVIQRRHLEKVSVIRLCGPSTASLPPFSDFPSDLKEVICGSVHLLDGGFQFDGQTTIKPINDDEVIECISQIKQSGVKNIVVAGVFAPLNTGQEEHVGDLIREHFVEASVTLSHKVGHMGLLERENAAILNESLKTLSQTTVSAFNEALRQLGLDCPLYLTQNDGTLLSAEQTLDQPIHTFASGPTNSMRGAAFLSGVSNAIVVDIGGTSTDVGVLTNGFPRQASTHVEVGGVRTNFRMPDVLSVALGGGSHVRQLEDSQQNKVRVGPLSVGYRLTQDAQIFGGSVLTASDIAVAAGLTKMGQADRVADLPASLVTTATAEMHRMLEEAIDQVKTSSQDVPVILVGGGSVLIDKSRHIRGASECTTIPFFEVANAVGAALSQVSGHFDRIIDLRKVSREDAIAAVKASAVEDAVSVGAIGDTVKIVDIIASQVTHQPQDATRLKVKAVGDIMNMVDDENAQTHGNLTYVIREDEEPGVGGPPSTGLQDLSEGPTEEVQPEEGIVDPATGEWQVSEWDLACITTGAGILGCGGGGNPHIGFLQARTALREGKRIRVITPERLARQMNSTDVVLPAAFMGAPLILIEKLPSGQESRNIIECHRNLFQIGGYKDGQLANSSGADVKQGDGITYVDDYQPVPATAPPGSAAAGRIVAITSAEIGGNNAMEPLYAGAQADLPVLDADGMGRAFPEIQMYVPTILGNPVCPAYLSDEHGRRAVVLQADSPKHVENHLRGVCVEMGCASGLTLSPLTREAITTKMVPYSISRAWRLGRAVLGARRTHGDPINAILEQEGGTILVTGKITDVERRTEGGFNRGQLTVEGFGDDIGRVLHVLFQNENLVAKETSKDGSTQTLACTPDLISLVTTDSGEPVPTEELRYGLRVSVLVMPAPPQLATPQALRVVGPQAFGYPADEVQYNPVGRYIPHPPVPYT